MKKFMEIWCTTQGDDSVESVKKFLDDNDISITIIEKREVQNIYDDIIGYLVLFEYLDQDKTALILNFNERIIFENVNLNR